MEIETKRATIDTMNVTIRALHVDGKQMTLSVFRQLPSATAYQPDGSLTPMTYWGLVRYQIRDEGAMWVVAEGSGVLNRCSLYHGCDTPGYAALGLERAVQALVKYEHEFQAWQEYLAVYTPWRVKYDAAEAACPFTNSSQEWKLRDAWLKKEAGPSPRFVAEPLYNSPDRHASLRRDMEAAKVYHQRCTRVVKTYSFLSQLPQLFIAV